MQPAPRSPTPDAGILERLTGVVERVTFQSPQSGFCVLRLQVRGQREVVTLVGTVAQVAPGEYVNAQGQWVQNQTHGRQFQARQLRVLLPSTPAGIEKYLGSGLVPGIGPHFAKVLVQAFGEAVFDVIEQEPQRVLTLPGIGPKRHARVLAAWADQKAIRAIMVFLHSHGVGTASAARIYKAYGVDAITRMQENPYQLALDIYGIGFKTADALAQRLGLSPDSVPRAQAGIRHVLQTLSEQGQCAVPQAQLLIAAAQLLAIPSAVITEALTAELTQGHVIVETIADQPCIFLAPLHRAELGVAFHLRRLLALPPPWPIIATEKALPWVEQQTGVTLSASQRAAVAQTVNAKVTIITGGPGVGKTTVVNSILRILRAKGVRVLLCAPTGRAAQRLAESTGLEAQTIHRLLAWQFQARDGPPSPQRTLDTDLVVIDEVSMVDVVLMNQLLRTLAERTAFLLVGDVDQLPSVGPGNVLADLIASGGIPTVRLTEIFRQAATSQIIVNAHRINQGLLPQRPAQTAASDFYLLEAATPEEIAEKVLRVVRERIPPSALAWIRLPIFKCSRRGMAASWEPARSMGSCSSSSMRRRRPNSSALAGPMRRAIKCSSTSTTMTKRCSTAISGAFGRSIWKKVSYRSRKVFQSCWSISEGLPKFIAIDEETNHEIVHGYRFGKANRATYEPLDPGPQIIVFALTGLRVLCPDDVLLRNDMPLIRPPTISVKARETKRLEQFFELQKDRILSPSKDVRQHRPTGVIDGMPQPPRLRFLPDITPHLVEF